MGGSWAWCCSSPASSSSWPSSTPRPESSKEARCHAKTSSKAEVMPKVERRGTLRRRFEATVMDQALLEGEDMKAVVIDEFGAPDVLHVIDRELPEPGTGQVRVRVRAAGVNPVDGKIRSGAAQQMFPTELPAVLGFDIAGTIDQVGPGIDGLAVGDDVLGFANGGGYAEYALTTTVVPKPAQLEWAAAAALPVAAETALRVLGLLKVTQGDTVLIHGAAGAVGTVAVQVAVSRGATVIGTASEGNHD